MYKTCARNVVNNHNRFLKMKSFSCLLSLSIKKSLSMDVVNKEDNQEVL